MKTLIVLFSAILFSTCNGATYRSESLNYKTADKEYSFKQEYPVSSPATLSISTSGGDIKASGQNKDVIEVSFIVKKHNEVLNVTLAELKELADVEINHTSSSLEINVKRTYQRNISVGFVVLTPAKTSCKFNTSGGDISTLNLTGNHNLNTSGGDIVMEGITGTADARTSGGDLNLLKSKADFQASTSGGDISMNDVNGSLRVSTSGGDIHAEKITKGLDGRTSGGDIHVSNAQGFVNVSTSGGSIGLANISGSVKAVTSGGDISAEMMKLNERMELKTSGGSIRAVIPKGLGLDLDLSADEIRTSLSNFTGEAKKDKIQGQMNGGGIVLFFRTSGGSISLDYK